MLVWVERNSTGAEILCISPVGIKDLFQIAIILQRKIRLRKLRMNAFVAKPPQFPQNSSQNYFPFRNYDSET